MIPAPTLVLLAALAQPAASVPLEPTQASRASVVDFVSHLYVHGMSYSQARDLGSDAVPILTELLGQADMKPQWVNIITAMAFIGDPSSHEVLHEFIWSRFRGEVDTHTFKALIAAQGVLGYIAAGDVPALYSELEVGVDPAAWARLPWSFRHYNGQPLGVLWSKLSITAISHTGKPEAVVLLKQLQQAPYATKQVPNIDEGLTRLARIQAVGLETFMRQIEEQVEARYKSQQPRKSR